MIDIIIGILTFILIGSCVAYIVIKPKSVDNEIRENRKRYFASRIK